ncbi:hypothetical protein [Clostridium sp.]|uniref:hypothetical protein n=1 Tax=Clostridium sp. TaxID=1506 RepID=UPI003D6CBC44
MITNILRMLLTRSFKPLMFTNKVDNEMNFDSEEIGIYVHIPFCIYPFVKLYVLSVLTIRLNMKKV